MPCWKVHCCLEAFKRFQVRDSPQQLRSTLHEAAWKVNNLAYSSGLVFGRVNFAIAVSSLSSNWSSQKQKLYWNSFNPFSPVWATFLQFLKILQSHNSPGDWAIELFKPSTDSASLELLINKIFFILGLSISGGNVTSRGIFALFWPSFPGPGRRPNGPYFGIKV